MGKHIRLLLFFAIGIAAGLVYLRSRSHGALESVQKQDRTPSTTSREPDASPDPDELEKLASLPYTNWSNAETQINKAGVIHFEKDKTFRGLNLYNSRNLSKAYLMDMGGKVIHTWSVPQKPDSSWHSIKIMENGDLLAIVERQKLIRLGWDSQIKWEHHAGFHHDLATSPDGLIYVIMNKAEIWETKHLRLPVVKEYITVLDQNGAFVRRIDLFDALSPLISEKQIAKIQKLASDESVQAWLKKDKEMKDSQWLEHNDSDVFHMNSIEIINRDIPGIAQKGDFLLSVRQLNLICIFRESTGKIVWSWGPGQIQCQHHAQLLENDHILLFDNGCKRGYSRVVEVDPRTKRIVWEYKDGGPKEFFSYRRGGVQRLANGNTLITESDRGRALEVSPNGKIVWEFFNPDIQKERNRRAVIFRMARIPPGFIDKQLGDVGARKSPGQ